MKQTRNITSILIFLLLIYTISATGFFLCYRKGYEVAAFLPIVAPVCSYFILRIFRNDTLKIDLKNISWKAIYKGALLPLVYMSACVLIYLCIGGKIMTEKFTLPLLLQLFVQWTFAGFCEEIGWRTNKFIYFRKGSMVSKRYYTRGMYYGTKQQKCCYHWK